MGTPTQVFDKIMKTHAVDMVNTWFAVRVGDKRQRN